MMSRSIYLAVPLALVFAGPAFADAIDGNWCHVDGRRFTIRGPAITTPAGNSLQGNYDRHYFSYPIPASEPRCETRRSDPAPDGRFINIATTPPEQPVKRTR